MGTFMAVVSLSPETDLPDHEDHATDVMELQPRRLVASRSRGTNGSPKDAAPVGLKSTGVLQPSSARHLMV